MFENKKILGLINARGGSKGIPGKNKKFFLGKELIRWSIDEALLSNYLDYILVSTDDIEIQKISVQAGANAPFLRPQELATDQALQIESIKHAIEYVEQQNQFFDYICLLQPTVPFRTSKDIDAAIEKYMFSNADSLISTCEVGGRHPRTLYEIAPNECLQSIMDSDKRGVSRQNFENIQWRNGAIYLFSRDLLMLDNTLYGKNIAYYQMSEEKSFNLDSIFDWELSEAYYNYKNKLKFSS